jgi:hypothetical protein
MIARVGEDRIAYNGRSARHTYNTSPARPRGPRASTRNGSGSETSGRRWSPTVRVPT